MVEDAPVAGSLNPRFCRPSAMAGAVAITWLAEAASTGASADAMVAAVLVRKPIPCTVIAVPPSTRARAGSCVICVENASVVAVVGTAVAPVVEDAQAKRRAGLERGVEPRHAEIRAVEGQARVRGRGKGTRVRQRPHTDYRLRFYQRSGFEFIERRHFH